MTGIAIGLGAYKGSALALTDWIGGRVPVIFDSNTTSSLPCVRGAAVRPWRRGIAAHPRRQGHSDPGRNRAQGLRGNALVRSGRAPAGTHGGLVESLNAQARHVLEQPAVLGRPTRLGASLRPMGVAQFRDFIRAETDKWQRVIRLLGARAD
jgi:tripartite-type tricarboxylate transporter receptor subunit TctC